MTKRVPAFKVFPGEGTGNWGINSTQGSELHRREAQGATGAPGGTRTRLRAAGPLARPKSKEQREPAE